MAFSAAPVLRLVSPLSGCDVAASLASGARLRQQTRDMNRRHAPSSSRPTARPACFKATAQATSGFEAGGAIRRRAALAATASALAVAAVHSPAPALAAAAGVQTFEQSGIRISVPTSWLAAEGNLPKNEVLLYADPTNSQRSAAIVKYRVQPDFTRMGSFGNPELVGMGLTASTPGSRLLHSDERESDGAYVIEYRVMNEAVQQHFLTVIQLKDSNLYTLSLQCPEETVKDDIAILRAIADSFAAI